MLEASGLPARAVGVGSLFNLHGTGGEITDNHAVGRADPELTEFLHLGLMNRGYFLAPRGMGCLSTAMASGGSGRPRGCSRGPSRNPVTGRTPYYATFQPVYPAGDGVGDDRATVATLVLRYHKDYRMASLWSTYR